MLGGSALKKLLMLLMILMVILLAACTSEEQKAYEDALKKAKDKIAAEEFAFAEDLLLAATSTGYEESTEAQNLLEQLEQYQTLDSLLNEGEFEEVYHAVEAISQIENGSSVISSKAEEFKTTTENHQQQLNELQEKVDESLKLVEKEKFDEANERLKALDLTAYQESFYESIKTAINKAIASNDDRIAEIKAEEQRRAEEQQRKAEEERKAEEARQKAEAEEKANAEAARNNNMLNWPYEKIQQYIADYFNMNVNHVIVEVYDRTSSGYSIEARQDNAALGKGDPGVAPALGFFEVREDGKLYKMDILSGNYNLAN
jgi:uncharacterized FlaG/YvyC family protein